MLVRSSEIRSIDDALRRNAERSPTSLAFTFLENGERESERLTFGQLDSRARQIAASLQTSTRTGERVLLLYPAGLEFICGFMGCLYAGVIAVPAYAPRQNRSMRRLQLIAADAGAGLALTTAATADGLARRGGISGELQGLQFLATDRDAIACAEDWEQGAANPDGVAMLQYTSGSTGHPMGVMVSHRSILSNMEVIRLACRHDENTVAVSWLPVFHDMGLFAPVLQAIYLGRPSVLMDPAAFVQKPVRWLEAITKYRGTTCGGPNSAYDLCVRKTADAAKEGLDLSSWSIAFNGAEPIRAETIERFSAAFGDSGFRREAMYPCYGLAEATLFVTGAARESLPVVQEFDQLQLGARRAIHADKDTKARSLVGCGHTWTDHHVRIVHPASCEPCSAGEIGEIWVSGGSVAAGYWNRPEESECIFRVRLASGEGQYLRTGDLGFMDGGNLFVAGRLKDIIIIDGRNLYPQDIERAAEQSHPSLVAGGCAAFSVEIDGAERVVVASEVKRESLRNLDRASVFARIRQALAEEFDVELYAALLLKPTTLHRTSSGKVQRGRCREAFLAADGLEIVGEWRQPNEAPARLQGGEDIQQWLTVRVARHCGIAAERVDTRQPFTSYGLGSKDAIAISGELQEWLGRPLSPALVYDYPDIERLARHLAGSAAHAERAGKVAKDSGGAIAIIGLGCRFPGAANPEEFWDLLRSGRDAIRPCDGRRIGTAKAGLVSGIDEFDAEFFGINAREAETMDPQQRLLLEVVWEALEEAGVLPADLAGSRTAVVIGISNSDYGRLAMASETGASPYLATGNALSIAANRISYQFDFRGPSWVVDTACSSSLVAVHQACDLLRRGECDVAVAGGVNLIVGEGLSQAFAQSGMLSPDGRCRAFDAAANGYVRGEGAGIVVLKRVEDATEAGDRIRAVIRGSAVNQDGRSNGLTAPNGPAQEAVIREALRDAGVEAREISYVEAHGTGTPLGDPIEMQSILAALGEGRGADDACLVGSVKTSIGHLESAAGIASLIKTVLALEHQEIPPHLHYRQANPHIALEQTPFQVASLLGVWKANGARRLAGVSSFGFGGTNAHVILEEAPVAASQERRTALARHQFQRRRYWIHSKDTGHPLLGSRLQDLAHLPATCVWESRLDTVAPLFEGHRVMGAAVLPWTAYAEMALAAASETGEGGFHRVADLALHRPVFLGEGGTHTLQSVLRRRSDEQFSFQVYDRSGADKWLLCASATILIDHEDEQDELRADVFCQ